MKDNKGQDFFEVDNIRITLVNKEGERTDWANSPKYLRIQSYRNKDDKSLHQGAEFPVKDDRAALELINSITKLLLK